MMTTCPRIFSSKTRAAREGPHIQLLANVLQAFPSGVGALTWGERLSVLEAWVQALDGVYAHLPLKRAHYRFDPLRTIEHLRQQVPALNDLQFHRELTMLIDRLRDSHRQCMGPKTLENMVASLPFLVEDYGPAGQQSRRRRELCARGFAGMVEWNPV
jgi:hypothetical protein